LAVAFVFFIPRRKLFAVVMCASRYGIYVECLTEVTTCLVAPIARRRQLARRVPTFGGDGGGGAVRRARRLGGQPPRTTTRRPAAHGARAWQLAAPAARARHVRAPRSARALKDLPCCSSAVPPVQGTDRAATSPPRHRRRRRRAAAAAKMRSRRRRRAAVATPPSPRRRRSDALRRGPQARAHSTGGTRARPKRPRPPMRGADHDAAAPPPPRRRRCRRRAVAAPPPWRRCRAVVAVPPSPRRRRNRRDATAVARCGLKSPRDRRLVVAVAVGYAACHSRHTHRTSCTRTCIINVRCARNGRFSSPPRSIDRHARVAAAAALARSLA
jgi:hypothetical protein